MINGGSDSTSEPAAMDQLLVKDADPATPGLQAVTVTDKDHRRI